MSYSLEEFQAFLDQEILLIKDLSIQAELSGQYHAIIEQLEKNTGHQIEEQHFERNLEKITDSVLQLKILDENESFLTYFSKLVSYFVQAIRLFKNDQPTEELRTLLKHHWTIILQSSWLLYEQFILYSKKVREDEEIFQFSTDSMTSTSNRINKILLLSVYFTFLTSIHILDFLIRQLLQISNTMTNKCLYPQDHSLVGETVAMMFLCKGFYQQIHVNSLFYDIWEKETIFEQELSMKILVRSQLANNNHDHNNNNNNHDHNNNHNNHNNNNHNNNNHNNNNNNNNNNQDRRYRAYPPPHLMQSFSFSSLLLKDILIPSNNNNNNNSHIITQKYIENVYLLLSRANDESNNNNNTIMSTNEIISSRPSYNRNNNNNSNDYHYYENIYNHAFVSLGTHWQHTLNCLDNDLAYSFAIFAGLLLLQCTPNLHLHLRRSNHSINNNNNNNNNNDHSNEVDYYIRVSMTTATLIIIVPLSQRLLRERYDNNHHVIGLLLLLQSIEHVPSFQLIAFVDYLLPTLYSDTLP
jgi:hypothetical protein